MSAVAESRPRSPRPGSRHRDPGLGVPEAARRRRRRGRDAGAAFLLESAEHGRVGRYSFIGYRPRKVLRWSLGDPGDPYELAQRELDRTRAAALPGSAAVRRRRRRHVRLRPGAHGRAARRAQPGPARAARSGADADRRAGRVRPPASARSRWSPTHADDAETRAQAKIAEVRAGAGGAAARAAAPAASQSARGRATADFESNMTREQFEANVARIIEYISRRRRLSGRAVASAGRRRCRSARSASTAACGPSTRARTCTSSTSATSRSPAPAPSRS